MTRLRRTSAADEDLLAIWAYVAAENTTAADRLLDRLAESEQRLLAFPMLGIERESLGSGVRALLVREYAIFYRLIGDAVEIVRVMDGRRDIRALDLNEL